MWRRHVRANHFPTFGWGLSLRPGEDGSGDGHGGRFPHLRVGTFIEAFEQKVAERREQLADFPTFGWGLSLRLGAGVASDEGSVYFPTFGWGLSLRREARGGYGF